MLSVGLPERLPADEMHYAATNRWKFRIDGGSRSSPALGRDGTIYLGSWDGYLFALNPDGTRRWRFKTGFEITSSPAIGQDGTVYVGCRDRRLYAVAPNGRKRWAFKSGGWVDASPAIGTNDTIYCGSWDRKFYALNADGSKQWEFPTAGPVVSSAAIDARGVIYFGSHDRKFYALNPDGSKRWQFATEGAIFVSVNQMHCAITPDGKFKWQRPLWNEWQQPLWNLQPGFFGETAAAVLANGQVVFTGGDAYVMTVPGENATKEWVWNYFLYGPSYSAPLVADDGTIYVMSTWPDFSALESHVSLATTPWPMFRGNAQHTGRVSSK